MAKQTIDPKRPPLLWDTIEDAFNKINDNFTELYLSVGGGSAVDLTSISSSINPADSMIFDLGTPTARWRRLYVGGGAIYVDNAPITATGSTLELPLGTKVGGILIKDPTEGSFKNIAVSGQGTVEAENLKDTLTLSGNGISITTNTTTDTITFTNSGVTSIAANTGISVSASTGAITISNTGVTGISAGTGISVNSGTGSVMIANAGVTELIAGSNIILSASTGSITITNGSPNILQNLWRFIAVNGQDTLDPISANATLTFAAGSNINITTDTATNTVTFSSPNVQDIIGSIFADDSTLLVDGVNGLIPATVVQGTFTGNVIGNLTGSTTGFHIGDIKGSVFGDDSTKIIDAVENKVYATFFGNLTGNVTGNVTGNAGSATVAGTVDITNTNGLTTIYYPTFVENRTTGQVVRADVDLTYRTDTNTLTAPAFAGNLTGTVTGNIFTNLIDSADSSQIVVTPLTKFESDVIIENDLNVAQILNVQGSRVINLSELKSIVASSSSFSDFQTRIAAL